jgi:hypothetical protein
VEDEGLAGADLDDLSEILHGLLDVDERVPGVVKDAKHRIDVEVDRGRLDARLVERLDLDPAGLQLVADRAVAQDHRGLSGIGGKPTPGRGAPAARYTRDPFRRM